MLLPGSKDDLHVQDEVSTPTCISCLLLIDSSKQLTLLYGKSTYQHTSMTGVMNVICN